MIHTIRGLLYMHANNILHLDIKPGNILAFNDGVFKLADFGHSRPLQEF